MTGHRPDTPSGADIAVRAAMLCAVAAVAGVAAWTSYLHTVAVVSAHGEDMTTAQLVPVTTDGLILAAGLVLLHSARSGRSAPALARWLLGLGIAATLAANVLHGVGHGPVGAVVAAWPATAFVGVSELALWLIRASARPTAVDASTAVSAPYEASRARERRAAVLTEDAAKRKAETQAKPGEGRVGVTNLVTPKPSAQREATKTRKLGAIGTGYSGSTLDKVDRIRDVAERGVVRHGKTETPAATVGRPDTITADTGSDTTGGRPVTSSASRPRPATASDSDTGPDTASDTALASVRSWLSDDPDMSGAAIGRRLNVSARTGQRLRAAALDTA